MDTLQPPLRSEFPPGPGGHALWGHKRLVWFKENRKPRKKPEPQIIEREVVRTEYVEVEKVVEVEVERIVEVERLVEVPVQVAAPEPEALPFDPLSEFIANEQREGETDEGTLNRLRAEVVDLFALQRDGDISPGEEARLRYLTGHIKLTGD